jgi:alkyl hydroperoxide reductase subunit F
MLDEGLKAQLKAYMERITLPIELVASLDDSDDRARDAGAARGHRRAFRQGDLRCGRDDDARKPSFAIRRAGTNIHVRFAGIPGGHEFTSLVLALLQVGGVTPKEDEATLDAVRALQGPLKFETYFSVTCQSCPDVVQALNAMASLNPHIEHVAIDGATFQNEVETRKVMAVPTVFLNGEPFDQGRMTLEQIVAKIDTGAAARAAEQIKSKESFEVLVVGGGPAGAAAAIYAARKGIRTGVAAERFGGQVLDTLAIENFISVQHTEGPKLGAALEAHVRNMAST